MFCPNCGVKLSDNSSFCGQCGAAIRIEQPSMLQVQAQPKTGAKPISKFNKPFVSGNSRTLIVIVLLSIGALVGLIAFGIDCNEIDLLYRMAHGAIIPYSEAAASDDRMFTIMIIQFAVFIPTVVAFCFWIYRAYQNLPALNNSALKYSPGWAVGWFFVPVMSLFRPFQVMREIWKASVPRVDVNLYTAWQRAPTLELLKIWWASWLVGNYTGYIAGWIFRGSEDVDVLLVSDGFLAFSDLLMVFGALALIRIIWNINRGQEEKNKFLAGH